MSVFTEQVTTPETNQEGNQSFMEVLIKTKGDKFKDPEVLAKSKLESDTYIEQLTARLKAQDELDREKAYLEGLKRDIMDKAAGSPQPKQKDQPEANGQTALKPEDIESLVEQTLNKRSLETKSKANLSVVEKRLEEEFGTEAASIVDQKAASLGMDRKKLAEIAAESPEAFFKLVELPNNKDSRVLVSTVNTSSMKGQIRDFKYYEALRKSNPKLANDPSYYSNMEKDRFALGDRFFK